MKTKSSSIKHGWPKRLTNRSFLKIQVKTSLLILLLALSSLSALLAQVPSVSGETSSVTFTPKTEFSIPENSATLNFAMAGSYSKATLDNGTWDFVGLNLGGANGNLPPVNGFNFSASAQDCNVTITSFDPIDVFPPAAIGHLTYNVSGIGSQTFSVGYDPWLSYNVTIDGVARPQNDGWSFTSEGWLEVTGASSSVQISFGERKPTAFTSADTFAIPQQNGTVSFASGGTYVFADFNGSTWTFQNLELSQGGSKSFNGYWRLQFSAWNSSVTVTVFTWNWSVAEPYGWVNYTVSGVGAQTLDPSYNLIAGWPVNYTVYIDGELAPQGTNWTLTSAGVLSVRGATANVSILGVEDVPPSVRNMSTPGPAGSSGGQPSNNVYLYVVYSVILAAVVVVSVMLLIDRKKRKRTKQILFAFIPVLKCKTYLRDANPIYVILNWKQA